MLLASYRAREEFEPVCIAGCVIVYELESGSLSPGGYRDPLWSVWLCRGRDNMNGKFTITRSAANDEPAQ
jgi:hypothetical protein